MNVWGEGKMKRGGVDVTTALTWGLFLFCLDRERLPFRLHHQLENVAGSCQPEVLCSRGREYPAQPLGSGLFWFRNLIITCLPHFGSGT